MSAISAVDFEKLYDQRGRDWALFDIREKGEAATLPGDQARP